MGARGCRLGIAGALLLALASCSDTGEGGRDGGATQVAEDGGQQLVDAGGAGRGAGAGGSGTGSMAGNAGGVATGPAYGGGCPDAPATGTCTDEGRACSYGGTPLRPECRERITCTAGTWVATPSNCPAPEPASACPADPPRSPQACSSANARCVYESGWECICAPLVGWLCDAPRTENAGCPTEIPNAGTRCERTTSCSYPCRGLTANHVTATCGNAGVWSWALASCAGHNG